MNNYGADIVWCKNCGENVCEDGQIHCVRCRPLIERVKLLEEIVQATSEMLTTIEDYRGQATTEQAFRDAVWRVSRMLERNGFKAYVRNDLDWRGSLLDELWQAGFYKGNDGLMHYDPDLQRRTGNAEGPTLQDVVKLAGLARSKMEPRLGSKP